MAENEKERIRVNISVDAEVWRQVQRAKVEYGFMASRVAESAFISSLVRFEGEKMEYLRKRVV